MQRHAIRALGGLAMLVGLASAPGLAQAQSGKTLFVAEPSHGTGNLPVYVSMARGFFADEGLDVKIMSVDGGSAHANAVLSGQAFAFVGGPEHNAFAKLRGADLRAVVNLNDRSTVYFVARKGQAPAAGQEMPDYMKGKSIAVSPFGGTPNSILRYLLAKWGLDAKTDVSINEMPTAAVLAAVKGGGAIVGGTVEPFITQGLRTGLWDEPFVNTAKELGPYAYTTLNVRLASIKDDPETVRKFVRGVVKGLTFTQEHRDEVAAIAKKEYPTMPADDLKATLDRSFADNAWSADGAISKRSWATAEAVVLKAGLLKQPVPYEDVIDTQFLGSTAGRAP